ncbi:hypothetical protein BD414DRAFT_496272 [Trametes punicea]|nr:hypothetical protein BD414DRAFT_496272 [Trametes punicea]
MSSSRDAPMDGNPEQERLSSRKSGQRMRARVASSDSAWRQQIDIVRLTLTPLDSREATVVEVDRNVRAEGPESLPHGPDPRDTRLTCSIFHSSHSIDRRIIDAPTRSTLTLVGGEKPHLLCDYSTQDSTQAASRM